MPPCCAALRPSVRRALSAVANLLHPESLCLGISVVENLRALSICSVPSRYRIGMVNGDELRAVGERPST